MLGEPGIFFGLCSGETAIWPLWQSGTVVANLASFVSANTLFIEPTNAAWTFYFFRSSSTYFKKSPAEKIVGEESGKR